MLSVILEHFLGASPTKSQRRKGELGTVQALIVAGMPLLVTFNLQHLMLGNIIIPSYFL